MFAPLILTACTIVLSGAAPAQQFLYGAPAAVVRLNTPILQPIVAAPTPAVYFSPGYPLVYQLRQTQGGFNNTQFNEIVAIFQGAGAQAQQTFEQLQGWGETLGSQWGQDWGGLLPTGGSSSEKLPASTMELQSLMEKMSLQPESMTPEMKTRMLELRHYYSVVHPQYFGNYDVVQRPLLSLQPLQVIRARSIAHPNQIKNDKFLSQVVAGAEPLSSDVVVPASTVPLAEPLKAFADPLVPVPVEQQPAVDGAEPVEIGAAATAFAKFLKENQVNFDQISTRSLVDQPNQLNAVKETEIVKEVVEGSVAQAVPEAAAVAGKAGTAEAAPIATAIVGNDGLAIAQPVASAVAGEFGGSVRSDVEEKPEGAPKIQVE